MKSTTLKKTAGSLVSSITLGPFLKVHLYFGNIHNHLCFCNIDRWLWISKTVPKLLQQQYMSICGCLFMLKWSRLSELEPGCCAGSYKHVYPSGPSEGQAKRSNESETIHHPRSKYEVSHVIRTWQKVSERALCRSDKWLLVSTACRLTDRAMISAETLTDRQAADSVRDSVKRQSAHWQMGQWVKSG